jgi:hypothetical protein
MALRPTVWRAVQSEAEAFAQSAAEPDFAEGLSGLHREARTDIQRKYLTRTETGRRLMLPGSNSISLVASFLATTTGARTHRRTSREFQVSIDEGAMW